MPHRWEDGLNQHRASQSRKDVPLVRVLAGVRLTSRLREDHERAAKPWFLLYEPSRDEFIDETIAWLFGHQADGSKHTWEKCRVISESGRKGIAAHA